MSEGAGDVIPTLRFHIVQRLHIGYDEEAIFVGLERTLCEQRMVTFISCV